MYEKYFKESDKLQVGDWFKQSNTGMYGVVTEIQKNGSPKGVTAELLGNPAIRSLRDFNPYPVKIDMSEVPDKILKKIQKKLEK